jgi:multiple sugar transport system permease protein
MRSRQRRAENRAAYLFLAPWFIGLVLITSGPLLASLYLAFTEYDIVSAPKWIGLQNFIEMFGTDPRFWHAAIVTLVYVFVSVPLVVIVSLGLAVLLDRGICGLAIYRTIFYIPSLLGASVAIALLWRQVFGLDGVFNDFLALFDIQGRSWIGNPRTALNTLIALRVWTFGAAMVIFLAALRQVPTDLYEASRIDGAGAMRRFRYITLPLLTPVLFFVIVLETIHSFQAFTQAHVISQGTGGPLDSTLLYTLYLYQQAFLQMRMGYGAAMAWVLLFAIATCTAIYFATARYWVFYDE